MSDWAALDGSLYKVSLDLWVTLSKRLGTTALDDCKDVVSGFNISSKGKEAAEPRLQQVDL